MTFKGHLLFSLANIILAKKIPLSLALAQGDWWHAVIGSLLTCLLPDIDHPRSILGYNLRWLSLLVTKIFGHRGFTHSLLAITMGIFFLTFLNLYKSIDIPLDVLHAMIVGYTSHIIADMLTPAGVPLLWPYRYRFRIPILRANKNNRLERVTCVGLLIFSLQFHETISISFHMEIFDTMKIIWKQCCLNFLSFF
ncbi:metal-dependent hydrolase [Candidatus Curculioniphilus buchneri]|uniref:metal-dependent hydrolase n=1 Tax=Candidatus Curculioniphilus buchneri TaxID=690594 RepID=UPI00376F13FB